MSDRTSGATSPPIRVSDATIDDCEAVADIYAHYVQHTVATFDYLVPSVSQWHAKHAAITAAGRPFVVARAVDDGVEHVVGYAYLGTFRTMPAYDLSTEDSIYVRPGHGGRGIGTALMSALLARADPDNVRQIVAVIAAILTPLLPVTEHTARIISALRWKLGHACQPTRPAEASAYQPRRMKGD